MNLQDRLTGMFIGGFLGDALGAPFEFKISRSLSDYRGLLEYESKVPRIYHEPLIYPIGAVTDDSQMTVSLVNSLIEKCKYDKNDVILHYIDFANSTSQLGKNTRALFKGIKTLRGYQSRRSKLEETMQSNGSLMRASPLSIFRDYNIWITDTDITNISQVNTICTVIYISCLRAALTGQSKEYIMLAAKTLSQQYQNTEIIQALEEAKIGLRRNVDVKIAGSKRSNKGWVVHALYAAFWGLYNFNDYRSAIDQVILLGGDTDTNAKIAGDLLGAYYGYTNLLKDEVTQYNISILLKVNNYYNFFEKINQLTQMFET